MGGRYGSRVTGEGRADCAGRDGFEACFVVFCDFCGGVSGNLRAGPTGWLGDVELLPGQLMGTDKPPQETTEKAKKKHRPTNRIGGQKEGPIDKNRETPVLFAPLRLFIFRRFFRHFYTPAPCQQLNLAIQA